VTLPRKHNAEVVALEFLIGWLVWNLRAHYDPLESAWTYTLSELLGTMTAFVVALVLLIRALERLT
jgi:hypothetical protein